MIAWEIAELLKALTQVANGTRQVEIRDASHGKTVRVVDVPR